MSPWKRLLYFLLLAFLLWDLSYSYYQYSKEQLDGDLQESILPSEGYSTLYSSPFGAKAIFENKSYPNTNRFFGHYTLKTVFTHGVWSLQNFTNPVDSVFMAAAISKLIFHFFLLFLLAACVTGYFRMFSFNFVLAMALITPLIQVQGYAPIMGITDTSITYVFFYSFPSIFLMLVTLPFVFVKIHSKYLFKSIPIIVIYFLASLVANFSGPLNPGSILIFFLVLFSFHLYKQSTVQSGAFFHRFWKAVYGLPGYFWMFVVPVCFVALYSFYLGTYNQNNELYQKSLAEMYLLLPEGIKMQFFEKIGYTLVFTILLINYIIIKRKVKSDYTRRILQAYRFVLIFAIIYILLLPLGGFRDYRPYILRSDSIIPITLSIFFLFGISTMVVLKFLKKKQLVLYSLVLVSFLAILQQHDQVKVENEKEKQALHILNESQDDVVVFSDDFTIVSWNPVRHPDESIHPIELSKIWNIIDKDDDKRFFQSPHATKP